MIDRPCSFVVAVMDFFGKKPDQSTAEFVAELKMLTDKDRGDLKSMLTDLGYKLT